MTTKKKSNISKKMIPIIVVAIMTYTIAAFILQFCTSTEVSPTLTTAYFAFWTGEILSLAGIRIKKLNGGQKDE